MANRNRASTERAAKHRARKRKHLVAGPSTGRNVKAVRTAASARPPADKRPGDRRKPWCTKRHTKARLLSLAEYQKEKTNGQKAAQ